MEGGPADVTAAVPAAVTAPVPVAAPALVADYNKISLNKMLLYTGELVPFIEKYINDVSVTLEIKINFLTHIYADRSNSGINIDQDYETVKDVELLQELLAFKQHLLDTKNKTALISLLCLGYAHSIHYSYDDVTSIPTLFLNPFFFPFHRAFILSDGIHDLEPRTNMTAKFWSKLFNTKDYRNKEDLRSAIFNTAVKPDPAWCDKTAQPYITNWPNLTAKSGHHFIAPNNSEERIIGNVAIPMIEDFLNIDKLETKPDNNIIIRVGDSSQLPQYKETPDEKKNRKIREREKKRLAKKKNSQEEEEEEEDGGGSKFNEVFASKFKLFYDFNEARSTTMAAVSDCAGPNTEQYREILNDGTPTSIVSGTMDSSSASNEGLKAHLTMILNQLDHLEALSIFLPEASITKDEKIIEVMQRITIGADRTFEMRFERWIAPNKYHCPNKKDNIPNKKEEENSSAPVPIMDHDKCPGVNETIQYIFSKLGVKNEQLLKAGACCLFGFSGGGEKLNADAETNDFLDKYYTAFKQIGIAETMDEMGGCLFRVKTMGDFYRLADTAFIQYKVDRALMGTCDEYNAINGYATNNFRTIFAAPPHHRFQWYGPLTNVTPEVLAQRQAAKEEEKIKKRENEMSKLHDNILYYRGKLDKITGKINTTIKHVNDFATNNLTPIVIKLVTDTDAYNRIIKEQIIDESAIEPTLADQRNVDKYKKTLDDNKIVFSSVINSLKINAKNKVYVCLTLLYLAKLLDDTVKKIEEYPYKEKTGVEMRIIVTPDQLDAYIETYTPIVKLLERVNATANVITAIDAAVLFANNPNSIIDYDKYFNPSSGGVNAKRLYQNPVTLSKNKLTAFDQLTTKLCAIMNVDNTNFLTLLQTAYSLNAPTAVFPLTEITQLNIANLYIPVHADHDPAILDAINVFINPSSAVVEQAPMIGGALTNPDSIIQPLINRILALMHIPIYATIDDFIGVLNSIKDTIDSENFYFNKRAIALHYSDLIEFIEYLLDYTTVQDERIFFIEFLNNLNRYFQELNKSVIEFYFKSFNLPDFITHYKFNEVQPVKKNILPLLDADLYSKFIDFMRYGIFIKHYDYTDEENITAFYQTYFYFDNGIKMVYIGNNDETDWMYDRIEGSKRPPNNVVEPVDFTDTNPIINQVLTDYAFFTFDESHPLYETFLIVIFLNNYNVDESIEYNNRVLLFPADDSDSDEDTQEFTVQPSELATRVTEADDTFPTGTPKPAKQAPFKSAAKRALARLKEQEKEKKARIASITHNIRRRASNLTPTSELRALQYELARLKGTSGTTGKRTLPRRLSATNPTNRPSARAPHPPSETEGIKRLSGFKHVYTLTRGDKRQKLNTPLTPVIEVTSGSTTGAIRNNGGGRRIRTRKYVTKMKKRTRKLNKRLKKRITKHKKYKAKKYTRKYSKS